MVMRLFRAAALVVLAIAVLALPLSALGLQYRRETTRATTVVSLQDGAIHYGQLPPARAGPVEPDSYRISTGPTPYGSPRAAGGVPVLAVAGAALVAVLTIVGPLGIVRRRRRLGACLACGYDRRASGEERCPECGLLPEEASKQAHFPIGRAVRDAGIGLFLAMLGISCVAYGVVRADRNAQAVQRARILDYSWFLERCRPRLTGEVAFAAPGDGPDAIGEVLKRVKPGATIVLLPGRHVLDAREATKARRVWLLGCGADTILQMRQRSAAELKIENLTIDCGDDPFVEVNDGGEVHLRNCTVMNYNSGAGGSNSFFGVGMTLLVDGCTFEGRSGRASGHGSFGDAFDLRGDNLAFVRDTRFIDNGEVWRSTPGTLDRCVLTMPSGGRCGPPSGSPLFVRDGSPLTMAAGTGRIAFGEGLDDLAILQRVPAKGSLPLTLWTDAVAREVADSLGLDGQGGRLFWRRLLLHPDPAIRAIAIAHDGPPPLPMPPMKVEEALAALSMTTPPSKDAVFTLLLSDPATVRPKLEAMVRFGQTDLERDNAAMILQLMKAQPTLPELVRFESLSPP